MHPAWPRGSSLEYGAVFAVVVPCQPGASPPSVLRPTYEMGSNGPARMGGIGVGPIASGEGARALKRTWVIVVVVAVVAVAGYLWLKQVGDVGSIDLVEAFRAAEKRTPLDPAAAFSIDPQTI